MDDKDKKKRTKETTRVSARLSTYIVEKLDEIADEQYRDRTSVVAEAVAEYVTGYEARKKESEAQKSIDYRELVERIKKEMSQSCRGRRSRLQE